MPVASRVLAPPCPTQPPPRRVGALRHARTYRPCLLSWEHGEPTEAPVDRMRRAALDWNGSLLVTLDSRTQTLFIAEDSPRGSSRERLRAAVHSVVEAARAARPEARITAVVGDAVTSVERLPAAVVELRRLAPHVREREVGEVVWARRYSLACLLETLHPGEARAFVEGQLAALCVYDREHGTNLRRVLELALDHDDRNTAARAAFMHRNTFRRQLGKALELVDADLTSPEERLALHLALKMRALGRA